MAAPILHVLGAHPVILRPYEAAINGVGIRKKLISTFVTCLRHLRNISLGTRDVPLGGDEYDVVFVGGLVDAGRLSEETDFYFGHLQQMLATLNVRSLLALRNQTGISTPTIAAAATRGGIAARLVLPKTSSRKSEMSFLASAIAGFVALVRRRDLRSGKIEKKMWKAATRELLGASTTANLRLEQQVEALCRSTKARVVIAMYEGHAWERCVWRGARAANPAITCVGYQHTIVRKHAHALRRHVGGNADPSLVFCSGSITEAELSADPGLFGTEFSVLGTHRRSVPAKEAVTPNTAGACIVLPEGMMEEARALFRLAADAAAERPERTFIFRSHPTLPFSRVRDACPEFNQLPANVEISTATYIEADLNRCKWMLYRGSSTVLYGILAGVKPFYLEQGDGLEIDPIFALGAWRESVYDKDSFIEALQRDEQTDETIRAKDWEIARRYCDAYVVPEQDAGVRLICDLATSGRAGA